MKVILVAPTAYKGTLSPIEVAEAIESGVREALGEPLDVVSLPIADGGDGTIDCLHRALGGEVRYEQVLGPTGQPVNSRWLKLGTTGVIELADCCGLARLPGGLLAPMEAHTYGLGQAIARCHEAGCTEINVAVGGSASTDGGMGALRALGAEFFDELGENLDALGGQALIQVADCDLTPIRWVLRDCTINVLTDVDNPLLGPRGAAAIFAPQKGATPEHVTQLAAGLKQFADVIEERADRSLRDAPGGGAAGGTAFGLACALGANITAGFDWVAVQLNFDDQIRSANLVITGEGRFDEQSLHGKAVGKIIDRSRAAGKQVVIVSATDPDGTAIPAGCTVIVPDKAQNGLCGKREILDSVRRNVPQLFHV